MKVFISWSGPESRAAAIALRDWLPELLQSVEPWVSSEDIVKGSPWLRGITDELQTVRFGILCITPSNANSAWMNFEAGAMSVAKGIGRQRVAPLLLGLPQGQLSGGPLTQFQATEFNEADVLKLAQSLNAAIEENRLSAERLTRQFTRLWPDLEKRIDEALTPVTANPPRSPGEMIEEVLVTVRALSRQQVELYKVLLGRPSDSWSSRDRALKVAEPPPPDRR